MMRAALDTGGPMPGPPPEPVERKRRLGNPGQKALPDPESTGTIVSAVDESGRFPKPLRKLGREGTQLWNGILKAGAAWIGGTDLEALQLIAELRDERAEIRRYLKKNPRDWRERLNLRRIDDRMMAGLSELGLTPAARTRLGLAQVQMQATIVDTAEKVNRARPRAFTEETGPTLVADLAPNPPKISWRKPRVLEWFEIHGIEVDSKLTKQELVDLVTG